MKELFVSRVVHKPDLLANLLATVRGQELAEAQAADQLYLRSTDLCGRFGLPLSVLCVEVWSRKERKGLHSCLYFDGSRWGMRRDVSPVAKTGPDGRSWFVLGARHEFLHNRKRPNREEYLVDSYHWMGDSRLIPGFFADYKFLKKKKTAECYGCGSLFLWPQEESLMVDIKIMGQSAFFICHPCQKWKPKQMARKVQR